MYEPTRTTYSASSDEALIAEAIENLPRTGERHHTIVNLEHQTVCLSVARAPADADCWEWYSAAAAERADLTSERLLPLVSAGNFDGWFYVAHDIGAAVPLSEYRRGITEISTARSLALLLGIAHALDDAVRQGKPPCEVTPDAVFLDPRLGAMIGDTGVAREALGNPLGADDPHAPWVAPEVLRGEDPHPRSPVYSFGAIAYTLLTGGPPPQDGPPRVSRMRTDLPATLDTVFAVAMAPEPQKRYATAAEARHLLNLVIYGAPSLPALDQAPRFRRGAAAQQPSPARHAPRLQPAVSDSPRAGRILVGLLIAAGLAGGAIAGTLAAGGDTAPPPNPSVSAAGMSVELPRGWNQQPAEAGRLEAHPQGDLNSGLAIAATRKPVAVSDQATAVQLGEHEAWRQDVVRADNGSRVAAYVIPTRSGKVEVTCTAATGSPTNTLALCERTRLHARPRVAPADDAGRGGQRARALARRGEQPPAEPRNGAPLARGRRSPDDSDRRRREPRAQQRRGRPALRQALQRRRRRPGRSSDRRGLPRAGPRRPRRQPAPAGPPRARR